jgi:hypothetical protein
MADLRYSVDVNTATAQRNLENLKKTVATTNDSFIKFKNVLGTVAIGSFITGAYKAADAISDIGKASGLGTQYVIGFTRALQQNGGSADTASTAIGRLSQSVQGALEGSKPLQERFAQLGITVDELAASSDKDIMNKVVKSLGTGSGNATKMAAGMDLLGRSVTSVDWNGVAQDIDGTVNNAAGLATTYDKAGQASDDFAKALDILRGKVLEALTPVTNFVLGMNKIGEGADTAGKWLSSFFGWIVKIGAVLATVAGVFALFASGAGEAGAAGVAVVGVCARIGMIGRSLGTTFGSIVTQFGGLTRALRTGGNFFEEIWTTISIFATKRLPYLGQAFKWTGELIRDHWKQLTVWIAAGAASLGESFDWLKEKMGFKAEAPVVDNSSALKKQQEDAKEALRVAAEKAAKQAILDKARAEEAAKAQAKINAGIADETNAIAGKMAAYQAANAEQIRALEYARDGVNLSERDKAILDARIAAERSFGNEKESLLAREAELKRTIAGTDKEAAATAREQLPLVQDAIAAVTAEYLKQVPAVEAAAAAAFDATQKQITLENLRQFTVSETTKAERELQAIQDEMAKMTLPELEQKYYDIGAAALASAQDAINAENERRAAAKMTTLSVEEEAQYRAVALQKSEKLYDATKKSYEMSRTFSTGWKKAMNEYVVNATNAASRAESLFKKATQGMEDAIVNFAKTGKFEWKNFISMMLEELLRSQIQQVFAQMMGNMSNSMSGVTGGGGGNLLGNLLGGIGSLFGGGSSGYMPGESGGIPTGNSGGGLLAGLGNIVGSIGSGIGSVVSGIGDFFGGFFANGGNLGAGKWGIAGENGPELISGPATVTPMGGGGVTNVTYNINAVDAMSFKQLVAQDPSFIHAVAMQGAKSMPSTRR